MTLAMSTEPAAANSPAPLGPLSPFEQLRYAKQIVEIEAQALHGLAARLDTEFCRAVEELYHCPGSVIVTGIGKAGLIGQKLAATLASILPVAGLPAKDVLRAAARFSSSSRNRVTRNRL